MYLYRFVFICIYCAFGFLDMGSSFHYVLITIHSFNMCVFTDPGGGAGIERGVNAVEKKKK